MTTDHLQAARDGRPAGHARWVRVCHWLIAASVFGLAYSGIAILMVQPRLYWGNAGNDLMPAWLELPISRNYHHGGWAPPLAFFAEPGGAVSRVRTYAIFNENGWARSLHFLVAWLFAAATALYLGLALATGHLRRALTPRAAELAPGRLWQDIRAHLRLPLPRAAGGPPYNVLQKLAYGLVALVALPVMILSGLAMSPTVGAAWPWLPTIMGGSQSARSIHFLLLCALILFLLVHLAMVVLTGAGAQLRAITWGRRHGE
ncbi:MAG: cytochrome b/b6 domain-containing protein [Caulobacterales bacterium]|nr:cytochrome b/b6 domain-containing protein [Caulobacterales bacterium]